VSSKSPDEVGELVAQWSAVRPDLDASVMAVVARLIRVGNLMGRRIDRFAANYGLNRGDGDVLYTLRRAGPPFRLSPSRLAESLLVTTGTMTGRLDRLETRGYIRRIPSATDRRSLDIELTKAGRRLVDETIEHHLENEHEMLAPLAEEERSELDRLLEKLLAHLAKD
jgi:DNA-binding MarR family transcriptional regulator